MKDLNFDHLGQGPIIGNEPEIRVNKKRVLRNRPKKLFAMENFSSFLENEENIDSIANEINELTLLINHIKQNKK
jgi:hypothetical protein